MWSMSDTFGQFHKTLGTLFHQPSSQEHHDQKGPQLIESRGTSCHAGRRQELQCSHFSDLSHILPSCGLCMLKNAAKILWVNLPGPSSGLATTGACYLQAHQVNNNRRVKGGIYFKTENYKNLHWGPSPGFHPRFWFQLISWSATWCS